MRPKNSPVATRPSCASSRQHETQPASASHAALINKLYAYLKAQSKSNRLVVTPTTYTHAWGSRDYIRELGAATHEDVSLAWTGPDTYAPIITAAHARERGGFLRRKPLVWDDSPVNDSDPWRPHLGALAGREAGLAEVTSGHISNPMSQACASMIPLATVADFLWNPAAYNPERSLNEAVVGQYGRAALRLLDLFLKTYRGDSWDDSLFTQLFYARQKPLDIPAMEQRLKELARALQVTRNRGGFQKLAAELAPFLTRTRERLSDGKLALREDYCLIEVLRLASPLTLDGDFSKWSSHRIYALDPEAQILRGAKHWEGPEDFAARAPFAWNENYLYVGVDVTDKELYQPAVGRGIENGDAFSLTVHTAFRKNYFATESTGDEYRDLCQSWRLLRGRAQRLFR